MTSIEDEFINLCCKGNLEKCQRLYAKNPGLNISAHNNGAFKSACRTGQFRIVKWLLAIKPNIITTTECNDAIVREFYSSTSKIPKLLTHYFPYYASYKQWSGYWVLRKIDRIYWTTVLCDLV